MEKSANLKEVQVKANEIEKNEKIKIVSTNEVKAETTQATETKPLKKLKFLISHEEYFSILDILKEKYPNTFGKEFKPLAIGIHIQLFEDMERPKTKIKKFLNRYTRSQQYRKKLTENAERYDLQGNVVGIVLEEHAEEAKKYLKKTKKN